MKPAKFDYARPNDIAAVLRLLKDEAQQVKLLAGGQSLGPMLNMRLVQPDLVVDLTGIDELKCFDDRRDEIVIGACVTHADIEDERVPDGTRRALPSVAAAIAYRAVRNRGTIGGSLTHADPSADWISMLSALAATVQIRGSAGDRTVAVEDYMVGALEADLRADEIMVSVTIPKLGRSARWGYYKSCRKTGEFAHAIGAYLHDPDRSRDRLVFGATESCPIVVEDPRELIEVTPGGSPSRFNQEAAHQILERSGMSDEVDRLIHLVALRRAVEQADQR